MQEAAGIGRGRPTIFGTSGIYFRSMAYAARQPIAWFSKAAMKNGRPIGRRSKAEIWIHPELGFLERSRNGLAKLKGKTERK